MSYVPGNDTRDVSLIAALVVGTIGATSLWAWLDHRAPGKVIGHCADGSVIGLSKEGVRRRPGRHAEERARARAAYGEAGALRRRLEEDLDRGALSLALMRYGHENESPWVIEGLDRERQSMAIVWEFDDEREAREVLRRLEERIVRAPLDADGHPIAIGEVDLDAVRERVGLETTAPDFET